MWGVANKSSTKSVAGRNPKIAGQLISRASSPKQQREREGGRDMYIITAWRTYAHPHQPLLRRPPLTVTPSLSPPPTTTTRPGRHSRRSLITPKGVFAPYGRRSAAAAAADSRRSYNTLL